MSRTKRVKLIFTETIQMETEIPLNSPIYTIQARNAYHTTLMHFAQKKYPQVQRSSQFDIIPLDQKNEPA